MVVELHWWNGSLRTWSLPLLPVTSTLQLKTAENFIAITNPMFLSSLSFVYRRVLENILFKYRSLIGWFSGAAGAAATLAAANELGVQAVSEAGVRGHDLQLDPGGGLD